MRQLVISKRRCEDSIKDWMHLAQDMTQFRALMNTVTSFQVSRNAENVLTT